MKLVNTLALVVCALSLLTSPLVADDYKPVLYKSAELVHDYDFDKASGPLKGKQWNIRQETTWVIKDGVLKGSRGSKEFEAKMKAKNDTHDGTRPALVLRPVPEELIIRMRLRYNGKYEDGKTRQLDLGHHINSFSFKDDMTIIKLAGKDMKAKKRHVIKGKHFPNGKWADITIELKEGHMMVKINDHIEHVKNPHVTLKTGKKMQQVDFKGLKYGTVELDWLKVYKGF